MEAISTPALSSEIGITPRTLCFYEHKRSVSPGRLGTKRLYSAQGKTQLKLTLRGKRLGLILEECRIIIDMDDSRRPEENRQLLDLSQKIREHRTALILKMNNIEKTLAAMDEEDKCLVQLLKNID